MRADLERRANGIDHRLIASAWIDASSFDGDLPPETSPATRRAINAILQSSGTERLGKLKKAVKSSDDVSRILALVESGNAPEPATDDQDDTRKRRTRPDLAARWHSFTADELAEEPPRLEFVWHGALPLRKAGVLAGGGGGGKTSLLVGLAVHRAIGAPFLGRHVRPGSTVILTTEDDLDDYKRKLAAWRDYLPGVDLAAVAEHVHLVDLAGVPFRLVERVRGGSYAVSSDVQELAALVAQRAPGADLIVLETVSRLGGDESNEAMSMLIVAAEQLVAATQATVLLVTHVSQNAAREKVSDAYAPRGGSAISDNGRFVLVLSAFDPTSAGDLAGEDIQAEQAKRLAVLSIPKINGAPPQDAITLERVPVPPGIVLRPYQGRTAPSTPEERRKRIGERLRQVVADARAGGMVVTLNRLQDDLRLRIGLSRRGVASAVLDAVADGFLTRGPVARGGGPTYEESMP